MHTSDGQDSASVTRKLHGTRLLIRTSDWHFVALVTAIRMLVTGIPSASHYYTCTSDRQFARH
jgi:hypothetical protein